MMIEIRQIRVDRWSVTSSRPFEEIVSALDTAVGHPNLGTILPRAEAGSLAEMKAIIEGALGPSGFMEFGRFDPSEILAKELDGSRRIRRLVIGNPLVIKEMVKHVPDAASYAPVTVLVVEGAGSVRLSYDTMASLIDSYASLEASTIARDLDEKIEALLIEAAK
jgi:uncharacterized protein (DUF302 family)